MSIANQIISITKEIDGLEKLVSLKTKVNKYNVITNKIIDAKKYVDSLGINKEKKESCEKDIDEKEYLVLLENIDQTKDISGLEIEELIKYYDKLKSDIDNCESYLNKKKMELISF